MSEYYYADSSALIKRHISETGSAWIKQEFSPPSGNNVITSKLSIAEVLSGLNRRRREASISAAEYAKFSKDFTAVSRFQYELMNLTDAVLLEAQRLLETHPLRAGDAIQLASALLANAQLQSANLSSRADFPRLRRTTFDGSKQRRFAHGRSAKSLNII